MSYDLTLGILVASPVRELAGLRNGSLASEADVRVAVGTPHVVAGTGLPADASTSDVLINVTVPRSAAAASALGVSVLANASAGVPFGGVLTMVNFTAPDANGTITALASIRTLNPCGSGSDGATTASFPILEGETALDVRILVDRSVVEVCPNRP